MVSEALGVDSIHFAIHFSTTLSFTIPFSHLILIQALITGTQDGVGIPIVDLDFAIMAIGQDIEMALMMVVIMAIIISTITMVGQLTMPTGELILPGEM